MIILPRFLELILHVPGHDSKLYDVYDNFYIKRLFSKLNCNINSAFRYLYMILIYTVKSNLSKLTTFFFTRLAN